MLDDNTGNGQRQKREECELRADGQHEPKRAGGEHQSVREYMIAGPSSIRTAFRSFVARAMMSPVRLRW